MSRRLEDDPAGDRPHVPTVLEEEARLEDAVERAAHGARDRHDDAGRVATEIGVRLDVDDKILRTVRARAIGVRHFGDHGHVHFFGEFWLRRVERFADRRSRGKRVIDDRTPREEVVRVNDAPPPRDLNPIARGTGDRHDGKRDLLTRARFQQLELHCGTARNRLGMERRGKDEQCEHEPKLHRRFLPPRPVATGVPQHCSRQASSRRRAGVPCRGRCVTSTSTRRHCAFRPPVRPRVECPQPSYTGQHD